MSAPADVLRAPFPWFGGKSRIASLLWRAFGNVPNYVEPFAGSLAVLLGRPHDPKIETVNDKDALLANFWRAIQSDPDAVAEFCDWPVSEADLHARHRWLLAMLPAHRAMMLSDPEYYDARIAGWWAWGLSQWIGGGWCSETHRNARGAQVPALTGSKGVHGTKRPGMNTGEGVHRQSLRPKHRRPTLCTGQGVHKQSVTHMKRPAVPAAGGRGVHHKKPDTRGRRGVHREALEETSRLPNLGSERGLLGADAPPCQAWFRRLAERLRRVRVCCGDWKRVLTDSVIGTTKSRNSGMNPCAILLDPPYANELRAGGIYAHDDGAIAAAAAAWARKKGDDPDLRIALCGLEGEHEMGPGWTEIAWTALRGYGGAGNENRHRERVWLSPHCLPLEDAQVTLEEVLQREAGAS